MKSILILLTMLAALAPLCAAEPVVVVQSSTVVLVDGENFGKPADVIANNRALAPAIQRALEKWNAELVAERDAAQTDLATLTAFIHTLVDQADQALTAGDLAALRAIVTAAREPKKARELTKLEQEEAAAQAKLAEIAARKAALEDGAKPQVE